MTKLKNYDIIISVKKTKLKKKEGINMTFNYSKLKGRICEKMDTQENFANALNLSPTSLSFKLNNKVYFTQNEMYKAMEILEISPCDINEYFFNAKV